MPVKHIMNTNCAIPPNNNNLFNIFLCYKNRIELCDLIMCVLYMIVMFLRNGLRA